MAKTPMMEQYLSIKSQYTDSILFYRLGDFYEMFYDDAILASGELELTLTGKDCGEEERAPMCGVPYHAAESYIGRLVNKGYKVVVCEQVEDPATAKGLVKRDVVRIVTPGTVMGDNIPSESKNNYLCSICKTDESLALSFCDITTGEMYSTVITGDGTVQRAINELGTYFPSEVIMNFQKDEIPELYDFLLNRLGSFISDNISDLFETEGGDRVIGTTFTPDVVLKIKQDYSLYSCIVALLRYINDTQKREISYIKSIDIYSQGQFLDIDISSRRNLELTETMRSKEKKGSLLGVIDKTQTSMGARMLRKWLELPLLNVKAIEKRLNAVEELTKDSMIRGEIKETLKNVLDLERLTSKLVYGTAGGRDLISISSTIAQVPEIKNLLSGFKSDELSEIFDSIDELADLREMIVNAICDDPPFSIREGGFIKRGYNEEVDKYAEIMEGGHDYIKKIEDEEKERTGITKLKIGYNRVFGYYIEISNSFLDKVPDNYIRKQTLANGERFITPELKDLESKILTASERRCALEYKLFCDLCAELISGNNLERIQKTSELLARIDTYLSLANVAVDNNYVRPEVEYSDVISIKEGRHPVVEAVSNDKWFVPNDTLLDCNHNRLMLITGPNMAGKSTYMRQVAIITIMAQMGSFVPAGEARIGVCDKIFTRVGASDDLASGQSTFMLEMTEVAYILKNATKRSLIIYDEIGRGTSTYDGMSIAKAVIEYTASDKIGAKTLFATHYHELTELEGELTGVVNYNIAAKKKGDSITFLRKIVKGATDDSYGIEVAQLAGVPKEVIRKAKEALRKIEESSGRPLSVSGSKEDEPNISFEDLSKDEVIRKLKNTDADLLTPIEALNFVHELKKLL